MNDEQYILILGATSDIAHAIYRLYASKGYNLYLASRDASRLEHEVKDLEIRYEIRAQAIEFDGLDYESHIDFYLNLDPKPYGVVSAIGYLGDQEEAEKNASEARKIIETNYNACVNILNLAANELERQGEGFIIGISSVAGDRGRQSNSFYGSSKAGFSAYLSGLRNRMAKQGIHVLTVKPGFVQTKMTEGKDLPPVITATPEQVAKATYKAQQKKQNVLYTKWYWRYIMLIIKLIPESIFKKMKL